MKNVKIGLLFFLAISAFGCGKDNPVTPEEELEFPATFIIDHYDLDGMPKFYEVGENDTYSEISVSDDYKTIFEDKLIEYTSEFITFFELRKLVLKSTTELEATYEDINHNTLVSEFDTVITYEIEIEDNKIQNPNLPTLFLNDQNDALLIPHRVYATTSFSFDVTGNLDDDFSKVADHVVQSTSIQAQDTFTIKFLDLIYVKE